MDRQVVSRLTLLVAIVTLVVLSAISDVSRVLVAAIAVPAGFVAGAIFLLGAPFAAVRKAEGQRLGLKRLLDVAEHAGPLAWIDLMILWTTGAIAFMGYQAGAPAWYGWVFGIAAAVGFIAALRDLFLAEEPDTEQESWQEHPGS